MAHDPAWSGVAATLRGDEGAASALAEMPVGDVVDAAGTAGVSGLLRRALLGTPLARTMLARRLDEAVMEDAVASTRNRKATATVLQALREAGIQALVFKGEALAHTIYPAPYLRPRSDADVLVRKSDFERAGHVLREVGYDAATMVSRELVHTQRAFRWSSGGARHAVDLHWAVSSRPVFAAAMSFDELWRDAQPVPALGMYAAAPSELWSLLIACLHRVAHHGNSDCLIWLYDIRLLAERLTPEEWLAFWALAVGRRMSAVCRAGLDAAMVHLDFQRQQPVDGWLPPSALSAEPSAAFLRDVSMLRMIALDAQAVPGLPMKARVVASHLFPDAAYVRRASGARSFTGLALAYARRLSGGNWRASGSSGGVA